MNKPVFFTRHSPRHRPRLDTGTNSRVRQSEKDNCDINKIMERFNRTGKLPIMQTAPPRYGDATGIDYASSLAIVRDAQTRFGALSAEARKEFNHNPAEFLRAIEDTSDANKRRLLKLGILVQQDPTEKELLTDLVKEVKAQKAPPKKRVTHALEQLPYLI